jgi:sugar phosphate isomerase/epimerase
MKLGINGATMKPWPLEAQIAAASSAGFEGLEIWRDKVQEYLVEHEMTGLVDLFASHRIEPTTMCFVYLGYGDEQQAERLETLREMVELAAGVGAGSIAVCAARNPPEGVSRAELLHLATAEAKIMAAIAADQRVDLFLEPLGLHPVMPGPM